MGPLPPRLYKHLFENPVCPILSLHWRHNDHDGVSNHQPHGCLLNRLFGRRSKKTSKLRVTGLCAGNSPGPVNSPHKGPVTRKMFPFDDVIMLCGNDVYGVIVSVDMPVDKLLYHSPEDTRRNNNIIIKSKRCRDVIMTLLLYRVSVGLFALCSTCQIHVIHVIAVNECCQMPPSIYLPYNSYCIVLSYETSAPRHLPDTKIVIHYSTS